MTSVSNSHIGSNVLTVTTVAVNMLPEDHQDAETTHPVSEMTAMKRFGQRGNMVKCLKMVSLSRSTLFFGSERNLHTVCKTWDLQRSTADMGNIFVKLFFSTSESSEIIT
uniref:Uncharacterized protein n=1 Tax=Cacopsylla melanoneura TaxID=428564 RepID=A0A8D8YSA8_9HEMI